MNPTLKAPGTKRLKLNYDEPLSNFALNFNLRRYSKGRILQGEANLQKRHEMRASQLTAMQAGRHSHDLPFGSPDAPFLVRPGPTYCE